MVAVIVDDGNAVPLAGAREPAAYAAEAGERLADGIVAEVYAAGETPIEGIDRDHFAAGLRAHGHREVIPLSTASDLAGIVKGVAKSGDLVVCLGAGNITQWAYALPGELKALG